MRMAKCRRSWTCVTATASTLTGTFADADRRAAGSIGWRGRQDARTEGCLASRLCQLFLRDPGARQEKARASHKLWLAHLVLRLKWKWAEPRGL